MRHDTHVAMKNRGGKSEIYQIYYHVNEKFLFAGMKGRLWLQAHRLRLII